MSSTQSKLQPHMPTQHRQTDRRRVSSAELFLNGQKEVVIFHQGEEYRLRITRQEKLILTK